jgi:hypothetical protein
MGRRFVLALALLAMVVLFALKVAGYVLAPRAADALPQSWWFLLLLLAGVFVFGYVLDRIDRRINPRRSEHFFVLPRNAYGFAARVWKQHSGG